MKATRLGYGLLLLLSLLLGACGDNAQAGGLVNDYAAKVNHLAPDFQLDDYSTGQPVKLSDFKGKPVLVNFWATWCPSCKVELPEIAQVYHQYKSQGLTVLGINMREDSQTIKNYLAGTDYNWTMLMDSNGQLVNNYGVVGYPTTFFIDRKGFIRYIYIGGLDDGTLKKQLSIIL